MKFKKELIHLVDDNGTDEIVYKQWISTDRSTLETFCVPAEQFVDIFCEKLEILRQHSFIASRQAAFYNNCKTRLHPRECLVTVDFAENYTFILQDTAQVFHLCCLLC